MTTRMHHPLASLVLLTILLGGCPNRTTMPVESVHSVAVMGSGEGVLGPLDIVEVRVYGEEELSKEYQIDADGTLNFPFIGPVDVTNLTPGKAAEEIARRLKDGYLLDPVVTIRVKEYNSRRIVVMGQVKNPGSLPYRDGMTVIQAIALAGGLLEDHGANRTLLTRTVDGERVTIRVRLGAISEGREPDIGVLPDDVIVVPQSIL